MEQNKQNETLWNSDIQGVERRVGPFHAESRTLLQAMQKNDQLGLLKTHDNGSKYTPILDIKIADNESEYGYTTLHAEAHIKEDDPTIHLAVRRGDAADTSRYVLTSDGVAVSVDTDDMSTVEQETDDFSVLQKVMHDTTYTLQRSVHIKQRELDEIRYEKQEARAKKIKRVRNTLVGTALSLTAAGGVYLGIKTWVLDPMAEEERSRIEYDTQQHQLPGEGTPIDGTRFDTITENEFLAIPPYGGSDTDLDNPRTVVLGASSSGPSCTSIDIDIPPSAHLYAAVTDESQFSGYHYETRREDDGFAICLLEENTEYDLKVAVQLRPSS